MYRHQRYPVLGAVIAVSLGVERYLLEKAAERRLLCAVHILYGGGSELLDVLYLGICIFERFQVAEVARAVEDDVDEFIDRSLFCRFYQLSEHSRRRTQSRCLLRERSILLAVSDDLIRCELEVAADVVDKSYRGITDTALGLVDDTSETKHISGIVYECEIR